MAKRISKVLEIVCRSDRTSTMAMNYQASEDAKLTAAAKTAIALQAFCDHQKLDIVVDLKNRKGERLAISFKE